MIEEYDQLNTDEQEPLPQQFEAEEERKLALRRVIVIGAIIFLAVLYFVWSNYLNFGYLKVVGPAPFSVNVIGEVTQECPSSPCEIKLKRGEKFIAVSKKGYSAESIEKEVMLWTSVEINPVFKIEPQIREVTEIPDGIVSSQEVKYKFTYDQSNNNYAIIRSGDSTNIAISYFGGKLQSPFIIGSDTAILAIENVADGKVFHINPITKERKNLKKSFVSAVKGSVSPNGRYFLIETSDGDLFVADKNGFTMIRDSVTFERSYWTLSNTLVLAYLQRTEDREGVVNEKYIFDEYNPLTGEQKTLFTTDTMLGDLMPKNIKINPETNSVFFESGETKFEIIF